ncbi:MAG TPA: hypothetical protein VGR27_03020 [Longimicrobiaceae bacterium]|nr:hypothetical protein [Longimicrobiaceae bacterium]
MAAGHVEEAGSEALLARKEELARAITEALYAEMPDLMEKYGESGRAKCLQDMRYNLEHLAPAVALGEPALFARYVAWLRDMLGARGIPADEVRRSLELTQDFVRVRLAAEQAELVAAAVAAGLNALAEERHA